MKKKLLIVSMEPTILSWKTRRAKVDAITKALNGTKNAKWEVLVLTAKKLQPEVVEGRITHEWFNTFAYPLFNAGYHHVFLHMSKAQWEELGLKHSLRGANQIDKDFVGDSYGWADEKTIRTRGQNQFVQVVLHEMSHELARATGMQDLTHAFHDAHADISPIFSRYDMESWQPVYQSGMSLIQKLMTTIASLLARPVPTTLFHPVQYRPRIVSQRYGVKNAIYALTGRHIGTDYSIPVNTPLHAPALGEVTTSGTHPALGHFCHFTYSFQGEIYEERWCHLSKKPATGKYSRGAIVAYSGNTGKSTGPHLHREVWRKDVRLDLINKNNWGVLTVNPETLTY